MTDKPTSNKRVPRALALTCGIIGLSQLLNETEAIAAQYAADSVACESKGAR